LFYIESFSPENPVQDLDHSSTCWAVIGFLKELQVCSNLIKSTTSLLVNQSAARN
jgi:hypothetical protein